MKSIADIRVSQRHALMLTEQPAGRRLAVFLLEFIRSPDCFRQDTGILTLLVTREDIAEYLGMTTETLSRPLTELVRLKLVERVSLRELRLCISGLEQFAGEALHP
ncbi:helix-turn-helix domain-containing protein [Acetobacter sp. AN02]|uniref:helix-turn-helix domain-containing protein n=1 Tax=Acetobacter sp. AN02 TaxID=2894186 RepID=UPI00243430F3|nr:helix-turn-helix domain-containing protein [Acetobacter sp. AN02]MDG6095175.1 helix-turn-helix domain-containing protein [Acetobacter sp. AN02]